MYENRIVRQVGIYKNCTEMHGQQNIRWSSDICALLGFYAT